MRRRQLASQFLMKLLGRGKIQMSVAAARQIQQTNTGADRVAPPEPPTREKGDVEDGLGREHPFETGMVVALGTGITGIFLSGARGAFLGALIGALATFAVFTVKSANRHHKI